MLYLVNWKPVWISVFKLIFGVRFSQTYQQELVLNAIQATTYKKTIVIVVKQIV